MGLELCLFEEGFSLKVLRWFIKLRFLSRWAWMPHEIMESWGVSFCFDSRILYLHWGTHYKLLHPFGDYYWVRTSVMLPDHETFVPENETWEGNEKKFLDGRWVEEYPYHYCLRDWTVQERVATVFVDEMEWRYRWWKFNLPWPRKVRRSINVRFSDEVGEKTGSWKGGTIGCAYDLRPNETPLECLRRMEQERKF